MVIVLQAGTESRHHGQPFTDVHRVVARIIVAPGAEASIVSPVILDQIHPEREHPDARPQHECILPIAHQRPDEAVTDQLREHREQRVSNHGEGPGHPLFAVFAQLISYGFVWALVRDWKYAFVLWAGIRVFALWVNLIQNYWTHDRRFGARRYDDPGDNAMNIGEWLPVMATFSACLQNNHHHYPHLLRLSHADTEFDFGFMTVKLMSALGLVRPSKTGTVKPADLTHLEVSL